MNWFKATTAITRHLAAACLFLTSAAVLSADVYINEFVVQHQRGIGYSNRPSANTLTYFELRSTAALDATDYTVLFVDSNTATFKGLPGRVTKKFQINNAAFTFGNSGAAATTNPNLWLSSDVLGLNGNASGTSNMGSAAGSFTILLLLDPGHTLYTTTNVGTDLDAGNDGLLDNVAIINAVIEAVTIYDGRVGALNLKNLYPYANQFAGKGLVIETISDGIGGPVWGASRNVYNTGNMQISDWQRNARDGYGIPVNQTTPALVGGAFPGAAQDTVAEIINTPGWGNGILPPVLDNVGDSPVGYLGSPLPALAISDTLTITPGASVTTNTVATARIQIVGNYNSGDVLAYSGSGNFTVNGSSTADVLILNPNGLQQLSQLETDLHSVTFTSTSVNVTPLRTVAITVFDANGLQSNTVLRTIRFSPGCVIAKINPAVDPTNISSPITFSVSFSQPMNSTLFTTSDIVLTGGATCTLVTPTIGANPYYTGYTITLNGNVNVGASATITAQIPASATTTSGGLGNAVSNTLSWTIDRQPPIITSITSTKPDGCYKTGDSIPITINFSEAVSLSAGTLDLTLDTGAVVSISPIASATSAIGTYTVAGGNTTDLNVTNIALSSGTLTDAVGNNCVLTLPVSNLATNKDLVIDNTVPTVTINQAVGQNDPTNELDIDFTVVFSEPLSNFTASDVTISGTASFGVASVVVSPPTGPATTYNVAVSGMIASGTVIATVNAAATQDCAGNVSGASTSTDHTVTFDNQPPQVTSITSPSGNGCYNGGDVALVQVNFGENVTLAGGNFLINLSNGVTLTVSAINNTTIVNALYFVGPTDGDSADLNVSSLTLSGGATLRDAATNNAVLTIPGGQNLADNKDLVVDNTPPTITCPSAVNISADAGFCYATGVSLGSPVTNDNIGVASVSNNAPGQFPVGLTTVTWTVSDNCGNTNTCTQSVTVTDNENPTITAPAAVNATTNTNCTATGVSLGTPVTADNCGVASVTNNAPGAFPLGPTTVTWTVTDIHGNTATATQTVTVTDPVPPTITAPSAVNATTNANCTATGVSLGTPVTADNCSVASVTNNAPGAFPLGPTTVTWTVTDGSGNTATATQTVTVTDPVPPTITAPSAVNATTNTNCTATGVNLGTPVTADNCSVASVTNNAPGAFPLGPTTVTWTVTDGSGNTATATQTVTVTDPVPPTITAPSAVSATTNTACTATGVNLGTPVTADNCSVASVTNNAPGAFPLGATTVTWTVTDGSGNTAMATQTVTVTDNFPPTITAPSAVSATTNTACTATGVSLGTPVTDDNCSVASVTNNAPGAFPLGPTTVTWTVTDGSGNTATATQTVTVTDPVPPTITAPAAVNATTNTNCTATGVTLGTPITADNCSVASVTNNAPGAFPLGPTTVTWTVTDGSGNTATATQTVTVTDPVPPTITAPAAVNATTNTNCTATGVSLGTPVTADNCSVASVTNDAPGAFPLGPTTVTWTVTDGSGNTATAMQTVTVTDDVDPTITAPAAVNATTNTNCTATGVNLGTPVTADNCSVASVTNDAPGAFPLGPTTVTWTVMDGSGNTATATQTVTVTDPVPPTITAPAAVNATTNTNCTATGVSLGTPVTADNCSVASVTNDAPGAFPLGPTTVTWTVTDGSGNTATAMQTVTVTDDVDPTITAPAAVNATTNTNCTATGVTLGTPVTADNCGVASVTNNAPGVFPLGPTTVTWTVIDDSGNTATATQTVMVTDDVDPTITAPAAVNATTNTNCTATGVTLGTPVTADNCSVASVTNDAPGAFPLGPTTVTWTVTDGSGNTATATQTVTVTDDVDPTITAPAAVNATTNTNCTATGVNLGTPVTADNCSVASVTNDAPGAFPLGPTTVTWTVTDGSGNTATATQTVMVTDDVDPTITAPAAVNATTNTNCTATGVSLGTPVTADNCGVASVTNDAPGAFPLGPTTVTWTVIDDSGNTATATQTVTVTDDVDPTITAPAAVNATTNTNCTATGVSLGTPVTDDNCSVASVTNDAPGAFPLGPTTVTWTVTDGSGNTATATQTVTVTDDVDPTITAPAAVNATTNTACTATGVSLGTPVTADNCSVASVTNDAPGAFPLGPTIVTWTVMDGSGNTATATQTVTVTDNFPPTITAPAAVNATTNTNCTATGVSLGTPVTDDNCSVASVTNDAPGAFPLGPTTVTWTVTDGSGNTATATQMVTVTDDVDPTITAPAAVNATTNTNCTATGVSLGTPVTADNCSVASVTNNAPGAFPLGPTTVTWTVTDGSGNTATATQTVTVTDDVNPTITAPAAVNATTNTNCTATGVTLGTPVTADNCGVASVTNNAPGVFPLGPTTVTWTVIDDSGNTATATQTVMVTDDVDPTITAPAAVNATTNTNCTATGVTLGTPVTDDNCSVASVTNDAPGAFPLGPTTVTWTVTDGSGNTATATQTVTVTDDVDPTITAPAAVNATTNTACTATGVSLGTPVTADNCSVASVTNDAPGAFPLGPTTVTWTVTDGSGNTATATQIVTVTDDVDPTITAPAAVNATTNTNCTATGVSLGTPVTADNCSVASVTNDAPGAFPLGPTTVTWTVTDGSGNTATATQTVTVTDDVDPTITVSASDDSAEYDGTTNALTTWIASHGGASATDNCSGVTWSNSAAVFSGTCGIYNIGDASVTFTATDAYANYSSTTATFTYTDTTAPVITQGVSIPVAMDEDGCTVGFTVTIDATDIAGTAGLTWSLGGAALHGTASVSGTGAAPTVTYTPTTDYAGADSFDVTVTDCSGNSDTITVNVTIASKNDAPVLDTGITLSLSDIPENTPVPTTAANGFPVSELVAISPTSPGNVSDVDAGAVTGVAITAADNTNGEWYFSIDGGSTWSPVGTVTANDARLIARSGGRIAFNPDVNWTGFTSISFKAWDTSSGNNGQTGDTTVVSCTSPYSSATYSTLQAEVIAVNDPPLITAPPTISVSEDIPYTLTVPAFYVNDPDIGASPLTMTVKATHGTLTFLSTTGLTFVTGYENGGADIHFSGTLAAVQAAITAGLNYQTVLDYEGDANGATFNDDTIYIHTNDGGATGQPLGVDQIDDKHIDVGVTPQPDPPTIDAVYPSLLNQPIPFTGSFTSVALVSGTTVTIAATNHRLVIGDVVVLAGSSVVAYSGVYYVTGITSANAFEIDLADRFLTASGAVSATSFTSTATGVFYGGISYPIAVVAHDDADGWENLTVTPSGLTKLLGWRVDNNVAQNYKELRLVINPSLPPILSYAAPNIFTASETLTITLKDTANLTNTLVRGITYRPTQLVRLYHDAPFTYVPGIALPVAVNYELNTTAQTVTISESVVQSNSTPFWPIYYLFSDNNLEQGTFSYYMTDMGFKVNWSGISGLALRTPRTHSYYVLPSLTPVSSGTLTIISRHQPSFGSLAGYGNIRINQATADTYSAWAARFLVSGGATADTATTGVPNFVAYALGFNASVAMTTNANHQIQEIMSTGFTSTHYPFDPNGFALPNSGVTPAVTANFQINPAAQDVTYTLDVATDSIDPLVATFVPVTLVKDDTDSSKTGIPGNVNNPLSGGYNGMFIVRDINNDYDPIGRIAPIDTKSALLGDPAYQNVEAHAIQILINEPNYGLSNKIKLIRLTITQGVNTYVIYFPETVVIPS